MSESETDKKNKVTVFQVLQSTIAAAIGVQSEKNRHRDFKHGKPIHYIIAGLVFTLVFIVALIWIVQQIVPG